MIRPEYFKYARVLGESQSLIWFLVYYSMFVYLGGFWIALYSTLSAYVVSFVLRNFGPNKLQTVPKGAAIFITGCSTGIGLDSAVRFANDGFIVYATVRKTSDKAKLEHKNIVPVIADVMDSESITAAAEFVKTDMKSRNVQLLSVINNAGYNETGPLEALDKATVERQMGTNVTGVITVSNAFIPLLRATNLKQFAPLKPSLIIVSSVVGSVSISGLSIYCASKYATEAISDGYRQELYDFGINVVCVKPGSIATEFVNTTVRTCDSNTSFLAKPELKELYEDKVKSMVKATLDASSKSKQPPAMVYDAFCEAILRPKPVPRIMAGVDANLFIPVLRFLPDAVRDMATSASFKTTKGSFMDIFG